MSLQSIRTYIHKLDEITSADNKTFQKQVRLKNNLIRRRTEMEIQMEADNAVISDHELEPLKSS